MFTWNPNDPPRQRMMDKLIAAQWVLLSVNVDKANGNQVVTIYWTPLGKRKLAELLELIREIEKASMPLTNDEIPWLKMLAEMAEKGGGELGAGAPRF